FNDHPIQATISGHFENGASTFSGCGASGGAPITDGIPKGAIKITNNTASSGKVPADTGLDTITYKGQIYHQVNTGNGTTVYGLSSKLSDCYGGSIIVLDSKITSSAKV